MLGFYEALRIHQYKTSKTPFILEFLFRGRVQLAGGRTVYTLNKIDKHYIESVSWCKVQRREVGDSRRQKLPFDEQQTRKMTFG